MPRSDPIPHHDTPPRQGHLIVSNTAKNSRPPKGVPGAPETPPRHGQELHTTNDTLGRKIKTTGSQIHKLGPILRPDIWSSLLYYFVLKGPRTRPPGGSKISPTCERVFNRKKRNRNQKTKNPVSKMCISFEPHPLLLRHESTTQSKTSACKTHGAFDTKPPTRSLCEPTSSMPSATPPSGDPIRNPSAPARPSSSLPVRKISGKG